MYDGVFMPGNKPALFSHYDWDCVVARTLIHLIFWEQTDKEHCGPTTSLLQCKAGNGACTAAGSPKVQREKGPCCLSGTCTEVSHCAVEGDHTTLGHVLPLYGRRPGCSTGLCSRLQWGEYFSQNQSVLCDEGFPKEDPAQSHVGSDQVFGRVHRKTEGRRWPVVAAGCTINRCRCRWCPGACYVLPGCMAVNG